MVKLYLEHLKLHFKKELEYKSSFILGLLGQIFIYFTYYFIIIALFQRFSNIKGFTMYEVLFCFSIINFGYSFNEIFFRGVDKFEDLIINGTLDRLLLRPNNVLFQVMCNQIDLQIRGHRRTFVILQKLRDQKYVWGKFLKRTSGVLYKYYLELR